MVVLVNKPRRFIRWLFGCILIVSHIGFATKSAPVGLNAVKTAMIFDLIGYIKWQNPVMAGEGQLKLCLYGQDDLTQAVKKLNGKITATKKLLVVIDLNIAKMQKSHRCQLLLIAQNRQVMPSLMSPKDVFVIANHSGSSKVPGSLLGFKVVNKKVRLWVDLDEINVRNLSLSSQILKIAEIQ